jgi:hypothetical protein
MGPTAKDGTKGDAHAAILRADDAERHRSGAIAHDGRGRKGGGDGRGHIRGTTTTRGGVCFKKPFMPASTSPGGAPGSGA